MKATTTFAETLENQQSIMNHNVTMQCDYLGNYQQVSAINTHQGQLYIYLKWQLTYLKPTCNLRRTTCVGTQLRYNIQQTCNEQFPLRNLSLHHTMTCTDDSALSSRCCIQNAEFYSRSLITFDATNITYAAETSFSNNATNIQ
jgi:hypothetical protein